ncbi:MULTISPECIES: type II secretion system minor pseudopilin GspJ [unclassified Sphingobium]|uniref:type II secretion system minor pseudopilin GspJ n=1 Tax=unclassified Sphingobium TaxID=2611147 RepID=UPI0022242256|nr:MULTISPECIES: type II secretion system minor pseudopilin GspJ [unclassified Sphingobium]MCW2393892.1 general secretion pathway protein J [Sphingobium sp. B8D3B]MCW2417406.1 general secretion pathway protein J [Sphingobium sp. B8D3C]
MTDARAIGQAHAGEEGFTLIELLVAVMIFAMLATAGVVLLRTSVDGQAAISRNLDALADVQRGVSLLDADLSQAVTRISRTEAGTFAPAFFGRAAQSEEPLIQFVRAGWSNPATLRRPTLQKIEYWWRDGRLERIGYPALDGAQPPAPSVLFEHVTALSLRYRARNGVWQDRWASVRPTELPTVVELTVGRRSAAPVTLRFPVGTAMYQPPAQEAEAASAP